MYKNHFRAYLRSGLLASVVIAAAANVIFVLSGLLSGHEIGILGQDRDTLYIVFITFATVAAVFIGTILFYFFQKYTKKPVLWFSVIVLLGFLFNMYTAEADLAGAYKITAHIMHIVVSGLALYIVPKLAKK
ncbi:DUF6069 family protein [Evansella clarkii]|uniref:DUF6069 family protein n=1 Tax=Evansella clarkii TaxID=79879 RepID=UPI001065DDB1|nr:DUF6069 family protein [Evansella clarkii]